ncbi:hypothetical protein F5Y03DRAFT_359153 [Xylaria venustula]|nr:hypothetical protein F5Y03DRAFT_359153 [Xylaria venustula]
MARFCPTQLPGARYVRRPSRRPRACSTLRCRDAPVCGASRPGRSLPRGCMALGRGGLKDGATVIDVGGSHGEAAIVLARAFPSTNLVVQDIDKPTILEADSRKPADIADRVRYMTHTTSPPSSRYAKLTCIYTAHAFTTGQISMPFEYCGRSSRR